MATHIFASCKATGDDYPFIKVRLPNLNEKEYEVFISWFNGSVLETGLINTGEFIIEKLSVSEMEIEERRAHVDALAFYDGEIGKNCSSAAAKTLEKIFTAATNFRGTFPPAETPAQIQRRRQVSSVLNVLHSHILAGKIKLPTSGKENRRWILRQNLQIKLDVKTLKKYRKAGEKIILSDDSIIGVDIQGRAWWQPSEKSKNVFYLLGKMD